MAADVPHTVVGFVRALRAGGLPVGVEHAESFAQALGWVNAVSRREVYLTARATLVFRREDQPVFDDLFDAYFGGGERVARPQPAPLAPRHDRAEWFKTALVAYMAERADPHAPEVEVPEASKAASDLERLQRKDFGACTPAELAELARALRDVRFDLTLRESRRMIAARRGAVFDLRRMVREAARHRGAVLALRRRQRKLKRRPLVVLADISGSMELYSRILLQFLHGLTRRGLVSETFVFGTRLTRLTGQLQIRDVDTALAHAAREIVDFAGGTRIGASLRAFNRLHARRVLRTGAVVLVISDGWETGDVALLDAEVRRLAERCYRLVWLNPLAGRAGYAPRVHGMATALAHVDDFLPAHDVESLRALAVHLARIPRRRGTLPVSRAARAGSRS